MYRLYIFLLALYKKWIYVLIYRLMPDIRFSESVLISRLDPLWDV